MCSKIFGRSKIGLVGSDQWDGPLIGNFCQTCFGAKLRFEIVPLQLHIEAIAENTQQPCRAFASELILALDESLVQRAIGTTAEANQSARMAFEQRKRNMRHGMVGSIEEGTARQFQEVGIALGIFR